MTDGWSVAPRNSSAGGRDRVAVRVDQQLAIARSAGLVMDIMTRLACAAEPASARVMKRADTVYLEGHKPLAR